MSMSTDTAKENTKENTMEECKWSVRIFGHYFQMNESGVLKIIGKREGQWITVYQFRRRFISKRKIMEIAKDIHRIIYGDAPVVGDAIDPITIAKIIDNRIHRETP